MNLLPNETILLCTLHMNHYSHVFYSAWSTTTGSIIIMDTLVYSRGGDFEV